ncbi:very short patch repair endonuclease [Microbacterium sp. NPDC057407]|uniref:very short patch repair endonuclease n=1 Tax=Microbacterium sp. NPDC057407 TaxID=3346120 RepID=UPI003672FA89
MGSIAVPPPSTEGARRTMVANRRRDTGPELGVRRLLHARGFRYRVDFAPVAELRSRADIVFTSAKVAVFIDGCFWHMCPDHFIMPKSNRDYWEPKLARNVERDRLTDLRMADAGWKVMRYWEHESTGAVADDIAHRLHAD